MAGKLEFHDLVCRVKELANELERTPTLRELHASGISTRQIHKHKFSSIVKAAGLEVNKPHATRIKTIPEVKEATPPKILFFDIETAPITGYTWGTHEQNVIKIVKDWFVLSYAAKFIADDRFYYLDQRFATPIEDDFQLLCGIHHLLSEADIVVTHNGDKFDRKKLNARFIKHGLQPLNHYQSIDTLKIARRHFAFSSNKLADLAIYLSCESQKSDHVKFPGFSMWNEMMKSNFEAFEECEKYNKIDVQVLIEVYKKLAPWEPSINFQAYYETPTCICGSTNFKEDGFKRTKQGKFLIKRCSNCHKMFFEKKNLLAKETTGNFFK